MMQILECHVKFTSYDEYIKKHDTVDIYHWLVTHVVEEIRNKYKEFGFSEISNNHETGGDTLIAIQDKIFHLQPEFSVNEIIGDLWAVGCGDELAIGACEALRTERLDVTGEQVVLKSLEIVEKFMGTVQSPFTILKTKS